MRVRHLAPFVAGLLAAFLLAGFPASAANETLAANGFSWQPSTVTIQPGESVTWTNAGAGTGKPSFVGTPRRRSSRKALVLELRSSDPAKLTATILRRPPRGRTFSRIGNPSVDVEQGRNVVTLPRKQRGSLRSGSYKLELQLIDAAGNRSTAITLSFKIA